MDKVVQNTFTKGLTLDESPFITPDSTLKNCLNGTILTFEGNEYILQNDLGNGRIGLKDKNGDIQYVQLKPNFVPLGVKEFGGILYIVSKNPITGQEEIGSFPSPEYGKSLGSINIKDSSTISYTSSQSTSRIFNSNSLQPGNYINLTIEDYQPEEEFNKFPPIKVQDLNNTITSSVQNKMGSISISQSSMKYREEQDKTYEYIDSKLIKDTSSNEIYKSSQCNTNLGTINIEDYNTIIKTKVNLFGIDSNNITLQTAGQVDDSSGNLYLGETTLSVKYNCPDGKQPYSIPYVTNTKYNYIEGEREVNYLKKILVEVYDKNDNPIIEENQILTLDITGDLLNYSYSNTNKLFNRVYKLNLSDERLKNRKVKILIKGYKLESPEDRESGINSYEFTTYEGEISDLIDLDSFNISLLPYDKTFNNKYNRFFWNQFTNDKIWGTGENPLVTPTKNVFTIHNASENTPQTLIWYVSDESVNIALFDIDGDTKYGKVLKPHIVGSSVQGRANELESKLKKYRSFYEPFYNTGLDPNHNYIILAYKINNKNIEVKDVQYFFPKITSTYGNEDYQNVIPASLDKCNPSINPGCTNSTSQFDRFGESTLSVQGKEYVFSSDDYGFLENGNWDIKNFGRQNSLTNRTFKFRLKKENETEYNVKDKFMLGYTNENLTDIPYNADLQTIQKYKVKRMMFYSYNDNKDLLHSKYANHLEILRPENNKDVVGIIDYGCLYYMTYKPEGFEGVGLPERYSPTYYNTMKELINVNWNTIYSSFTPFRGYNYDLNVKPLDSSAINSCDLYIGSKLAWFTTKSDGKLSYGYKLDLQIDTINVDSSYVLIKPYMNYHVLREEGGQFFLDNTKITDNDLRTFLIDKYQSYILRGGVFLSITRKGVKNYQEDYDVQTYSQNDEIFLFVGKNKEIKLAYFPANQYTKDSYFKSLGVPSYIYQGFFKSEDIQLYNFPKDITEDNLPKAEIKTTDEQNTILYKGKDAKQHITKKLKEFGFSTNLQDIVLKESENALFNTSSGFDNPELFKDVSKLEYFSLDDTSPTNDFYAGYRDGSIGKLYKVGERILAISNQDFEHGNLKIKDYDIINQEGELLNYIEEGAEYKINAPTSDISSVTYQSASTLDYKLKLSVDYLISSKSDSDYLHAII